MNFLIILAIIVATVLLAIVLERVFTSPILVTITIFAIYLIILAILSIIGSITELPIAILIVTLLAIGAYITAVIVRFIRCICNRFLGKCCTMCPNEQEDDLDLALNKTIGNQITDRSKPYKHKSKLE